MMLNRGELDGARILKPETVDLMTRNHLAEDLVPIKLGPLPLANMGFGLDFAVRVKTGDGEPAGSLGEYWWGGAASTQFFVAPRENLICVGMTQFMPATPIVLSGRPQKAVRGRARAGGRQVIDRGPAPRRSGGWAIHLRRARHSSNSRCDRDVRSFKFRRPTYSRLPGDDCRSSAY